MNPLTMQLTPLHALPSTWASVMQQANVAVESRMREERPTADAEKLRSRDERMRRAQADDSEASETFLPSDSSEAIRRSVPFRDFPSAAAPHAGAASPINPRPRYYETPTPTSTTEAASRERHPVRRLKVLTTPAASPPTDLSVRMAKRLTAAAAAGSGAFIPREIPAVNQNPSP